MYSIRTKLNVSIISTLIVVLSFTAVFLHTRIKNHVVEVYDSALYDKSQALISLTELDEEGLEFDFAEDGVMTEFLGGDSPEYYQLWENGERLLIKSPSLGESDLPYTGTAEKKHRTADILLPDGRNGRLIEINFMPRVEVDEEDMAGLSELPQPKLITLVLARERVSLNKTLFAIRFTIIAVIITVLMVSTLLIWYLIGRGLIPLSSLAQQVSGIDESSLHARVQNEGGQIEEIAPIQYQLNHLLERLQSAFEREKRFSSNVAHELRTPMSELRTLAEVGQMVPDDPKQISAFFTDVGEISRQMENIVTTLLELTRSEAGLLRSDPEDIELSRFCDGVWMQAVNGMDACKQLVRQIPADLIVSTDREKLGMILKNLFINAVSYSPEQAEIQLSTELQNNQVMLSVKNIASDLKPEDLVYMKDRFWRKDKAKGDQNHSGLGLTLVEALARILQLDVHLSLDNNNVFIVTISGFHVVAN
ncbi:MAG: ATP-binding protein [Candidatus Thiodiazotropha sp.]|uniref:histidine kinase n=1 Tax=Candidatus Thiodiazotropha taylori TaxID=2792791 RepID=A0A944M8R7_9GAMM|nr:hypothetical protein [Candidatus Thiodiazotropha taylori]MBT3063384.1 hypothetical protein [Candidatus Thiodiazotropha sp. (ex Lucina pensylvanica)]PUB76818.1 MAG: hypothetical protein DBO99_12005 [gamma proteobacterium symbiont of Ctena orbiculata]MBT3026622.1 hypothetical protein [Candidatus Thiodiazotropha taylori]MBT3034256.1 hypothetical protein [Candidatus Thiodiazotropha taylori]